MTIVRLIRKSGGNLVGEVDKRISIIAKACNEKKGGDWYKGIESCETNTYCWLFYNSKRKFYHSGNGNCRWSWRKKMAEAGFYLSGKEGYRSGRWILLDFKDIVVHIFHKEDREFYNLEKLWADSEKLLLDDML